MIEKEKEKERENPQGIETKIGNKAERRKRG